jgi:hypothetical protein
MPKRLDGKKSAPRASAAEKHRINRLFNLIRNGGTRTDCIRFAAQTWNLSESTTDKLLVEVRKQLKRDFEIDREQFAAELMQQASSIQMEARRTNNLNVALGAINTLARLAQLE